MRTGLTLGRTDVQQDGRLKKGAVSVGLPMPPDMSDNGSRNDE